MLAKSTQVHYMYVWLHIYIFIYYRNVYMNMYISVCIYAYDIYIMYIG